MRTQKFVLLTATAVWALHAAAAFAEGKPVVEAKADTVAAESDQPATLAKSGDAPLVVAQTNTAPRPVQVAAVTPHTETVTVSARRVSEDVQKVPVPISVVSGDTVASTGAYNLNRLTQQLPSVQFFSQNPRNTSVNIRGIGAPLGLTNDGIEQGVGIYVDQVYYNRVASTTLDFVDVEQIEVLRGPQGTLYGKNTTAGALNVTTRAPSFTPESKIEVSGGNYDFVQAKASISGPLTDKLAIRVSASGTTRHGTIYDVASETDLHRQRTLGLRGQLLWKPTDTLNLTLSGDFNVQNPLCCVQIYARVGTTQRVITRQYAALAAAFAYTPPSTNPFDRVTDLDASINSRQEVGGTSLLANWDIGPATLTSVTAWRYWDWKPANDRDFIGLPITTVSQNPSQQKQISQEIRLASNGKNKLDYTVGAFLFHQTINTQGSQVQGSAASKFLLSGSDANNPNVLNGLTSTNTISFDNTSFAVFGKLNWALTDKLHIQPGLRVNYDKKSGYYNAIVSINNSQYNFVATADTVATMLSSLSGAAKTTFQNQINTLAPQRYSPSFGAWNVSGDINVSYDFTPDVHGYATYSRSFKSGGINLSGLPLNSTSTGVDLTTQTVKPEKVNAYEIGLKTQFLDRRVTLNVAGFWTDISDYQATVNNNAINVIRGYLANAGKVRSRGFEFDSSFRPSPRLNLYFNGAYTDAKYIDFKNAPCPPELAGGTVLPLDANGNIVGTPSPAGTAGGSSRPFCDISGQRLPGISKWSLSYGAEYNVPVGGSGGEVYVGYDGNYRSRFSSNPSASAYTWIEGYSLSSFRAGYRKKDFNVFGWVRNAFNQNYFELLSTQSGSTGLIVGQPGDPRTFGGTISKSF